jgi:hypothetical protein
MNAVIVLIVIVIIVYFLMQNKNEGYFYFPENNPFDSMPYMRLPQPSAAMYENQQCSSCGF